MNNDIDTQSNSQLQVYYMSTKTKFNVIYCNHMFHSHSILKSTFPNPFYLPLLSYRTLQPQINPNECVQCVCVKIWRVFHICDRKYRFEINFSVRLINDYLLIADLHIFVYGRAECAIISLDRVYKDKLLILNNFD